MWHSLEHMTDPKNCLKKAHRWLKNDGILIIDVPNYTSHDAVKTWTDWVGWDIPHHFYHFTKDSLVKILHNNGFSVIRSKHYLSEYVKEYLESFFIPSFIARIIAGFYSGHSYAVVARKNTN